MPLLAPGALLAKAGTRHDAFFLSEDQLNTLGNASAGSWDPPSRRLHVIERDAPLLDPEPSDLFEQTVTLSQPRDERPVEFGLRVLDRIAWAERLGRPFDAAALSAATSTDVAVLAARRLIALGIRSHGQTTGRLTRLLLVASPHCGAAAKDALLDLADELLHAGGERPSVISVRFGATRERKTV